MVEFGGFLGIDMPPTWVDNRLVSKLQFFRNFHKELVISMLWSASPSYIKCNVNNSKSFRKMQLFSCQKTLVLKIDQTGNCLDKLCEVMMIHTLPDGVQIDLSRIRSVSSIRDLGSDPNSIDLSRIGFSVHLNGRELIQIIRNYHYADWAEVRRELNRLRAELIQEWEEFNARGEQ